MLLRHLTSTAPGLATSKLVNPLPLLQPSFRFSSSPEALPRGLAIATLDPASSGAGPTGPYLVNKPFTEQPSSSTSPRSPAAPSSTPKAGFPPPHPQR